ncbi:MAG TPA: DNA ligase D [Candidatus Saccharimonadales bacterium]|nr:DNA ligase D [Candidatus Saccharimonadales bacterium]
MSLRKYLAKRRFDDTPEPRGKRKKTKSKKLAFVVQEHHASRLHYDFRLELDGVLKSWAVPKGPSMNPEDHHLAVHVEDHPFAYRKFEGTIPEGNYGAGKVIIWDEGTYEPYHDGPDDEATLRKQLEKGHLTFILHGKKLHGEFALIKMHGDDEKAWLLIKKDDEFASHEDITKQAASVKSGKVVDDIGKPAFDKDVIKKYPAKKHPWQVKPMLCTLVDEPFSGEEWLFEIKWDGYRAIASKDGDHTELYSRAHTDFKAHYPPIAEALKSLKHDVILDGEIMVVDSDGVPHFEALQNWRRDFKGDLVYYAFDILWCDGHDLRDMPLYQRKQVLKSIIDNSSVIHYSDHVEANGKSLFNEMKRKGLEGMVAKKTNSTYRENIRGKDWLKVKTHLRQEVVIGGFTEPRGGRKYLGSLILGVYRDGAFEYVGHSGGGIPDNQRKLLRERLEKLERKTSPFSEPPKPNAPVHWTKPEVVTEMSFSEWTSDGRMRHPVFEGLRADKKASAVHRENPQSTIKAKEEVNMHGKVALSHLDKVFFPKHGYTKGDIISYYEAVAPYILPYLKDRPLSLLRQPNGITEEGFFQKNHEHLPDWVPSTDIFSDSNNKDLHWIVGGSLDTLRYIVQLGSIEVNPWNSRTQHLDKPDWLVIDLDPEGVTFKDVITVARTVKEVCDEWKVDAYPKTSGKTGIHIFIPLGANYTSEQAKNFAHLIALEVNARQPNLTSVERIPAKRPHRIYLDFLQNREGQTLAAPYSVRPTPDATVSTPLRWDEVKPGLKPTDFTIKNMPKRLEKVGDLWKPVTGKGVNLAKILDLLEKKSKI